MKPILKQIIVPTASAITGGLIVLGALKLSPTFQLNHVGRGAAEQGHDFFYDDIFKEQNRIRKHFDRIFDNSFAERDFFGSGLANKLNGETVTDISQREDEDSVYYDIKLDNVKPTSVNTKVENGYVSITGTTEKRNSDENANDGFSAKSFYKSTFSRTFPLPEHVDQNKMQMTSEKDRIVLKFPKTKV